MKIGVVGTKGGWSTERIADCIEERTGQRFVIELESVQALLQERRVLYEGVDLCSFDALIVKKLGTEQSPDLLDRVELLRFIESCGVLVLSKPDSIVRMLDRLSCTVTLASHRIPMPETAITEDVELASEAVRKYGQAVFKPLFSTKARGMWVANWDDPELLDKIRSYKRDNPVMYLQKRVDIPGRDLGVVFLDGKYVGTYARVGARGAWNTTTHSGGKYASHEPSEQVLEIAHRAQALFGLSLTSVDVVETTSGPVVFEVSAFGGFRGLSVAQGVDVARLYVDQVIATLSEEGQQP